MSETYSISILTKEGKNIGSLPSATPVEVSQLINKGFVVINNMTKLPIDISEVSGCIGISECVI